MTGTREGESARAASLLELKRRGFSKKGTRSSRAVGAPTTNKRRHNHEHSHHRRDADTGFCHAFDGHAGMLSSESVASSERAMTPRLSLP